MTLPCCAKWTPGQSNGASATAGQLVHQHTLAASRAMDRALDTGCLPAITSGPAIRVHLHRRSIYTHAISLVQDLAVNSLQSALPSACCQCAGSQIADPPINFSPD